MAEPTISDVAKLAGVAISTVSRVFNDGPVRQSTRLAILEAAASLGYRGNASARSLAMGRKQAVGIVVRDLTNYYTVEILAAITDVLQRADYRIMLADVNGNQRSSTEIIGNCAQASDGLILVSPALDGIDLPALYGPDTTVLANRTHPGYAAAVIDETANMRQAVRHLHSLGHRHIVYLAGPQNSWSSSRRQKAFLDACERLGACATVLGPFEATHQGGHKAGDALTTLLDSHNEAHHVTAAIAFNDALASGALVRLAERGTQVPEDCSIIGVDDSLIARTSRPQLTSIATRQRDIGAVAARLLLNRLETGHRADRNAPADRPCLTLTGTLTVRGSTAAAPKPKA